MTAVLDRPPVAAPARRSSGWGPALRIARRELARARGRTVLVLLMVLLPVAGVAALDTLLRTGDISVEEGLPEELGTAQARIDPGFAGVVRQSPDASNLEASGPQSPRPLDEEQLLAVLPEGTSLVSVREGVQARAVRTGAGAVLRVRLLAVDLPVEGGLGPFAIRSGRAPATPDEVLVTSDLERAGFSPGTTLPLGDGERTVTGTVELPRFYGDEQTVVGLPAGLDLVESPVTRYYASGPPVLWQDVLEANALGAIVLSRAVVLDPPTGDAAPRLTSFDDQAATTAAIVGLITVMAVLEVVLLAGPAFAIGARRQRRSLALLAAGGGEPRHVRRVVLAQGVVIGSAAAVLGLPLGVLIAALAREPLTRWADATWGPFEVSVRDLLLIGLLGAGTALLAALVPALVAGRQPVVPSLLGRRSTPVRAVVPTLVGLVLFVVGVLMCLASLDQAFPELWVAFSALPTVIGAVLLAPALLALLGRCAGRLPLPLRYAVRDADRQRARTAPAVAAIAATVAAVVALGTSATSDQAERRAAYAPSGPPGTAVVSTVSGDVDVDWVSLERAVTAALPEADVTVLRGIAATSPTAPGEPFETLQVCLPSDPPAVYCNGVATSYGGSIGGSVLVGPQALEAFASLLEPVSVARARAVLAAGGVAVAGSLDATDGGQVELRRQLVTSTGDGEETAEPVSSALSPAAELVPTGAYAPLLAVASERVGRELGGVGTVALLVGDGVTDSQEEDLREAVLLADPAVQVSVERGYDDGDRLVVLVLGLVAGTLVLAGTLAASSLALVEARPDFTTLGQVGARPRTRRTVAAAYAFVLAAAGAALGIAAGLVPGIAAAVSVTRYASTRIGESPPSLLSRVEIPWLLLLGLLVVLPLLVAGVAAATSRGGRVRPARRPA